MNQVLTGLRLHSPRGSLVSLCALLRLSPISYPGTMWTGRTRAERQANKLLRCTKRNRLLGMTTPRGLLRLFRVIIIMSGTAAEAAKDKGNEAFKAGNYREAIRLYSEAIRLDDSQAAFYTNRAAAYLMSPQGEAGADRAFQDCKSAISRDPKFFKAWARGGKSLARLGKFDEALDFLCKAPQDDAHGLRSIQSEVSLSFGWIID